MGSILATRAIAYASLGEAGEATRLASAADELSRCAHIRFSSRFARLLADLATERTASGEEPNALLQQAHRAGCVDPFVMSYRSHPALLGLLTERSRRTIALPAIEAADDRRLAKKVGLRLDEDADGKPRLTAREQEVQSLMRSGLTNAEIARRLVISPSTAKVHARNVLRKYGVRTRVELATAAADEDLRSR